LVSSREVAFKNGLLSVETVGSLVSMGSIPREGSGAWVGCNGETLGEHVTLTREDSVATVTMARPEVHNAFNEHLIAQLHDAVRTLSEDDSVRVIVLAGEGKSFSAGADLDWMRRAAGFSDEENLRDAAAAAALWRAIAECPKPVVARVHGNAFGGGAGLVAASDIAIASEQAMFGFTEVRLGLVPATVAPHVVEKIGPGRALPLFLAGERFDARRALEIGLVHRVVEATQLAVAVGGVIDALLSGGPDALATCKELVRHVANADRSEVDGYTAAMIADARAGAEGREGVSAFLEKRKPGWIPHPQPVSRARERGE
jgi:methylglutaconyl-CoA hydratase